MIQRVIARRGLKSRAEFDALPIHEQGEAIAYDMFLQQELTDIYNQIIDELGSISPEVLVKLRLAGLGL